MLLREFDHIDIIAKRWFQKTYGNTYHSVIIKVDGVLLDRVPFTYGYGDHYLQTAHTLLSKHGYFEYERTGELVHIVKGDYHTPLEHINKEKAYKDFIQYTRDHYDKFTVVCTDVERKKDL